MSSSDPGEVQALQSAVSTLQAQNAALRQLVVIHDRLGALVLQGADVGAITCMTADLVGRRVLLLDALLQVVTMALPVHDERPRRAVDDFAWAPRQGYVRAVLATLARERRPLRVPPMADFGVDSSCVLAPVAVGDAILGYLAILAEGDTRAATSEDLDLQIVQHAATVYALSMMRERVAAEVARQLKDELFEGLLSGRTQDEQVARERAMRLGYNPGVTYRVLVVMAEDAEDPPPAAAAGEFRLGNPVQTTGGEERPEISAQRRRLLESLAELCARKSADGLAAVREDELVVLVAEPTDARELGRTAVQQASALLPAWRVTVGVGGVSATAGAIARSYAQARRALETAQRFGHQSDVVAFEDLGVYRLLFHVTDPAELRGFIDQALGPLIEYDQRHNADFVRTLGTFLSHNGNLQATARELNLHVNSVTYRVQRIQSIASLDLEQSEDRLLAQVALKILGGV
jgi:GGDEF-like domain/PucR C-terminal helix-turn-helix domain